MPRCTWVLSRGFIGIVVLFSCALAWLDRGATAAESQEPPKPAVTAIGAVRLITLPKLDSRAIRELIGGLITKFELENGYAKATSQEQRRAAAAPERVTTVGDLIARSDREGRTYLLRFGFLRQSGQLPQLWLYSLALAPGREDANPDAELVNEALRSILESRKQREANIPVAELETRVIKLSYVDAESAMYMLRSMGINALVGPAKPGAGAPAGDEKGDAQQPDTQPELVSLPKAVGNEQLPLVVKMLGPSPRNAGLVGGGEALARDALGLTVVLGATARLAPETVTTPTSQLMVLFNPEYPEQFARVRKALHDFIDQPARQILVEGMVLEISKDALDELGVTWSYQHGLNTLLLGSLRAGAGANTLDFTRDTTRAYLNQEFLLRIQALVRQGRAEVLSRPSVLTLDNRQATIRVGTDIPIATSRDASSATESRVSFSFQYLPTGIQLNVRPRADNEGKEVSMLIDASVSSTVPGQDLALRSPATGQVLASAPTIATRRVQTYARIPDNTPLIIGGLISLDNQEALDKVPGLGDLPLIGNLFRSTQVKSAKREVIIVLTPYVLAEGRANFPRALPKDDDAFDSLDNALFRDAYRLRAGDVFDTGYIRNNRRLLAYRELVQRIAIQNPAAAEKPPFSRILDNGIPGEHTLVNGMIYETLRRHNFGGQIVANRMLMFSEGDRAEFRVRRLDAMLAGYGDGKDYRSFFSMNPDKALAITFHFYRDAMAAGDILAEPKPQVSLVACCKDRTQWLQILWDMNQRGADGLERYTILIKDESDIVKLSRAIVLKRLTLVNGGESRSTINNFLVGRQIAIPEVGPTQTHLIDAEVARNFFHTELYYPAFEAEFEQTMDEIDRALRGKEFGDFIKPEELPPILRTGIGRK